MGPKMGADMGDKAPGGGVRLGPIPHSSPGIKAGPPPPHGMIPLVRTY